MVVVEVQRFSGPGSAAGNHGGGFPGICGSTCHTASWASCWPDERPRVDQVGVPAGARIRALLACLAPNQDPAPPHLGPAGLARVGMASATILALSVRIPMRHESVQCGRRAARSRGEVRTVHAVQAVPAGPIASAARSRCGGKCLAVFITRLDERKYPSATFRLTLLMDSLHRTDTVQVAFRVLLSTSFDLNLCGQLSPQV